MIRRLITTVLWTMFTVATHHAYFGPTPVLTRGTTAPSVTTVNTPSVDNTSARTPSVVVTSVDTVTVTTAS